MRKRPRPPQAPAFTPEAFGATGGGESFVAAAPNVIADSVQARHPFVLRFFLICVGEQFGGCDGSIAGRVRGARLRGALAQRSRVSIRIPRTRIRLGYAQTEEVHVTLSVTVAQVKSLRRGIGGRLKIATDTPAGSVENTYTIAARAKRLGHPRR